VALLLCTELFYRGFALRSVARSWPRAAALIVLPIYVLDHVGAPMPELVGSAAAGLILGQLALVTRSIWPGFAIHVACALAVDLGTFLY
jgi:membrane protease YdiL (CAAX protease family)